MGRPKEKGVTQSAGSSLRDHTHLRPHNASTQRKRQRRAAQKTCDSSRSGAHRERESPSVSRLDSPDSGPNIIQIDDSQHVIGETWLPDNWAAEDYDLTSLFDSEFTPQLCANLPESDFSHLSNASASILHNPEAVQWPDNAQVIDSTSIDSDLGHIDMNTQSSSESSPDIYEDCLHRLLSLQSGLCKTAIHAPSSSFSTSLRSDDHPAADQASFAANARPTDLDMILRNTQTLIDILQLTPPSSPRAPHFPHDLDRASQLHLNSTDGVLTPSTSASCHPLDSVVTLLSLSCYSTILVAYDVLVASLMAPSTSQSDNLIMQPILPSPALTLGTFSITARSSLFVSTVLHVVKQLMEQLQSAFRRRFPVPETASSMDGHIGSSTQPIDGRDVLGANSIFSYAYSVLREISVKENKLMELLAVQGQS
ncbi:hypothetical protein VTL71DRAFT_13113 [Oculimacula yallundae]|uniref:Uncharacterized protein n=1 Tax=Oculimacula yallundae TaxID=86028 RepID=A0ABR4CQ61_9HELO